MDTLTSSRAPRALGPNGLVVSPMAWGMWRFKGDDLPAARERVEAALDAGLTLFDTADIYGPDNGEPFGAAEALLGRVLAEAPRLRDRMVLATKAGIEMGVPYNSSADYLVAACEACLKRLRTERVELFQIHRPDLLAHPAEVARALERLRQDGKIAEAGVSNHTPSQTAALMAHLSFPLASIQPEFSAAAIAPLFDGVLDQAMERNLAVLAWSPLGGGRLMTADSPVASAITALAAGQGRERGGRRLRLDHGPSLQTHPHCRHPESGADPSRERRPRGQPQPPGVVPGARRRPWRAHAMTANPPCEVSWFSALCDDDYEFLGVPDPGLLSSWDHCRTIALTAEAGGFDNLLLPSGYALGIDSVAFGAAIAPSLKRMRLLAATRCGEMWPPQLARQLATLDQMLEGRLTVNIISSDLPGETLASAPRYARTLEVMRILKVLLAGKPLDHQGEFYKLKLDPPRIATVTGRCPPLYFGGLSPDARECSAAGADVYLMWPDTLPAVKGIIDDMTARAAAKGRTLKFGYRVHVVVRETEAEARAAADRLLSHLDDEQGKAIRERSLDSQSAGVRRQAELRESAGNEGYAEDNLWTGIGRARSGCGAAIVGDPDQVLAKLNAYRDLGIEAFILSGYPHAAEADLFARHVLPRLDHGPLAVEAS